MVYCVVMYSMTSMVDDGGSDWMANGICFFGPTAGGFRRGSIRFQTDMTDTT